ncbi:XRE family transcriptional regulator [Fulvimarina sp. 2208YS6-2-32]|uniref:XRE family transcriptional regulator n=1 Tax=Fulvimarina uroteuthidis TaxID=3098149 RepID=A0ABU5I6A5_9HYPH|nr:XRE family transcriptional regulator [Fulvimarina sp. 2208YS6-2-32]MDY8110923.1 XRE family transcriptional regulator [Fulvimarina sp. 2208YS6-2-32]
MIYSDKQYTISEAQLVRLRDALAAAESEAEDTAADQRWLRHAQTDAIRSQIATLEAELSHYDLLKSGEITFAKSHSLENLPSVLVQARIAAGMSQTDLAERLGMKAQQIQRYEASEYSGASFSRLIDVCEALNVHATGLFERDDMSKGAVFSWSDVDDVVWKQLPAREMARRGWFDVPRKGDVHQLARKYFMQAAGAQFASAYHRKKMHGSSMPNEYALLAWQARILERARAIVETHNPPNFVADDRWVADLIALTRRRDGPKRAQALLLSKGIILVTEKHLSGTYLDGGAMLDRNSRPVIGLTLRFDRLDNFWFVLLHELGHVFLHLMDGLRYDFFDEEETSGNDKVEREADEFALDSLIPEAKWDECLSRFALSEEAVRIDAKNLGIDASIIAGRIRKERGDYTILNGLIGQGQVASQFEDDGDELV